MAEGPPEAIDLPAVSICISCEEEYCGGHRCSKCKKACHNFQPCSIPGKKKDMQEMYCVLSAKKLICKICIIINNNEITAVVVAIAIAEADDDDDDDSY